MADRVCKIFNGIYTIQSTRTGDHRTFRISTQVATAEFAPGLRVVGLLTGPDNQNDYTGFGFVDEEGIHVWSNKRGSDTLWEKYAEMLWSLALDAVLSPWVQNGYRLMMEGRCLKCNRVLTEPTSVTTGIGPVCAERAAAAAKGETR